MKNGNFLAFFSFSFSCLFLVKYSLANFFESDGRLPQIELAIKACKKGSPLFAAVAKDGIAVCYLGDRDEWTLDRKVSRLTDSLYISGVGIASDVSFVVQQSQTMVMDSECTFGQSLSLPRLSRRLSNLIHSRSLRSDERPLGMTMLMFGEDSSNLDGNGFRLQEIDTLGNLFDCQITCIGRDAQCILDCWDESIDISSLSVQELVEKMSACMKASLMASDYPELCNQVQSLIYQDKRVCLLPNLAG